MGADTDQHWRNVGAAWSSKKGQGFDIRLNLGVFGDVKVFMRPNNNRTNAGQPEWNLVVRGADTVKVDIADLMWPKDKTEDLSRYLAPSLPMPETPNFWEYYETHGE